MKLATLPLALLLIAGAAQAHDGKDGVHISCDLGSDYSISTHRQAFVFTRDESPKTEVGIGGGRLFIDGREQTLAEADHQRLREMEGEWHAFVPQMRQISLEAVNIAFTALTEVARALASDPPSALRDLEQGRRRALAQIERQPLAAFDGDAMKDVIEPIVSEFVPQIVGGAVTSAMKMVFSGEAKRDDFEKRMARMEKELDENVDKRAKALEPLANAACARMRRIDALDDQLAFRLPNGEPLQLLRVDRHDKE